MNTCWRIRSTATLIAATLSLTCMPALVQANTLSEVLVAAYNSNPELQAARRLTIAVQQNQKIARAGYLPNIAVTGLAESTREMDKQSEALKRTLIGLTGRQPLSDWFKTANKVRQSELEFESQLVDLHGLVQKTLLDAAVAFGDILKYTATFKLARNNVRFVVEQLRAAKARFSVGHGTKTEVAQAETHYQKAVMQLHASKATLASQKASLHRITGGGKWGELTHSLSLDTILPRALEDCVTVAFEHHPEVSRALYNVEASKLALQEMNAKLLPSVSLYGRIGIASPNYPSGRKTEETTPLKAVIGIQLEMPLYTGGRVGASISKASEMLNIAYIQLRVTYDKVREGVIKAWNQLTTAKTLITAAKAQTRSAELALASMMEEHHVGQRTLLDVLEARTHVVDAHTDLVSARRDHLVASFALTAAIGRLDPEWLGLKMQ